MIKPTLFKGKVQFVGFSATEKNYQMKYNAPSLKEGFQENLTDTMMASFENINFTTEEKKHLSRSHRKMLNYYRHLNLFTLNMDAQKLIQEINQSKQSSVVIEANHYGAYICLAALYSGKLSPDKKIEFILEKAPLALFPKVFIKSEPKDRLHKVVFNMSEDCWLSPFTSLNSNHKIKCALKTAKKVA